jgi:hypothetical protein
MNPSVDSIINIPTSIKGNFFKCWLRFLLPYHNLTNREMDIAAAFLMKRHQLSKVITDVNVLDSVATSEETKREVREMCDITIEHFQVIMSKLRKSQIIIDNKLNPRFIPRIKEENGNFKLLLLFTFNDTN